MKIFVFGSSITSSYWNGAATYYRGIYKNLHALGHEITFAEPDIYGRQQRRDDAEFAYVTVEVYQTPNDLEGMLASAADADLVIKHSGIGADDEHLETRLADLRSTRTRVAFWDVDSPATLARVAADARDHLRPVIPELDFVFTYGGGAPVVENYLRLGARNCHPIYNALDPETHHATPADVALACDLAFVGNRLPDRERRVEDFFLRAAQFAPELSFVLGGEGWSDKQLPSNVRWIGHVGTDHHNRVNCSAGMVMNINRESMASVGFSPPTRVFEAAGAGACVITDSWPGIDAFFEPGREILVANSAEEIVRCMRRVSEDEARSIGTAMRERALREHTYESRAAEVNRILADETSAGIAALAAEERA